MTPKFVSVHKVYLPNFGEDNAWGARRWQSHELSAVDEDGNVWGLYSDSNEPFDPNNQRRLRWLKYEVARGLP